MNRNHFLSGALCAALVTAASFWGAASARADETPSLQPGQTLVTLTATDQKDVEQDLLVASMRIEVEDKDPQVVQDKINKAMQQAVELSKKSPELSVSTGQYYVYSVEPETPIVPKIMGSAATKKITVWRGSQSFDVQSKDSQKVLDAVAGIQGLGFVMNSLTYTLSPELAEKYRDELMTGALKKIQEKAGLIAKTLGKSGYDLVEVNVDGAFMPSPMPMLRGMAKMEMSVASDAMAVSAPVAMPGKTTVSLNVASRVILKP